ncbi:glycerate kinase [Campylobacter sp. faydin G-140]|uniref:glycerate kinase family protein n=1 Tax=Campylobacter anatolicus TaxID=2829105 RepID=UPI001B996F45|nr:glycerate kinase [Campylobacter anatolicus]MBR8462227.1 glycerate kinase [Campylobacter anatolicus]MBR8465367.1 glycerate kinase [Campylobacter anatolicus]
MRVLVATDSFKGSLSSLEAATAIKEALDELCDVVIKPIADGGEGSVEALCDALNGEYIDIITKDPIGNQILARYAIANGLAIMEMASASGLTLLRPHQRDPRQTSTYGFGLMIKDAIAKGARKFIIGIGGSATNDAGTGMLNALGFEFFDKDGNALVGVGKNLIKIAKISTKNVLPGLSECEFLIACDVDNQLYGKNGAAYVYGPQKGADGKVVKELDDGLINFANVVQNQFGTKFYELKGAGAAGGLGFGFVSFLNAKLESGIKIITQEIGLEDEIKMADLIITGEGKMDFQSSMGKTPTGVAQLAKKYGKPVIAFAGCVHQSAYECNDHGIDAFFSILNEPVSLEEAMRKDMAIKNLKITSVQAIRLFMINNKN